ncbi:MAG TPA: 50S ribosomal protein L23 [Candidatus Doudnabacteria bacterium]|nr:50S ribosomal protein L23 [Candidatus Doudnabacteria bacterium]
MALFSKKENTEDEIKVETTTASDEPKKEAEAPAMLDVPHSGLGNKGLIVPRVSEKAGFVDRFNQYIFTVYGKLNKIEVRRAVEKMYGVKVANVNMIQVQGKSRTFGRKVGQRSGFKKAMVTLTKDSKKINIVEPS